MNFQDDPDVDPPMASLWTVVAWLTASGVAALVGLALLRKLDRGWQRK